MKADILLLAAGFGTRLRPLTDDIPKPMIKVAGRTLIDINLSRMAEAGFTRVIINTHYLAEKLIEYLGDGSRWGLEIVISHEKEILGTGGAVKNIKKHLKHDRLFIYNCDILVDNDFSFTSLLESHQSTGEESLATLVLRQDPNKESYGLLGIDSKGKIVSFLGESYDFTEEQTQSLMFSGISVLEKKVLDYMQEQQPPFSLTQGTFRNLLLAKKHLNSSIFCGYWNDVGTHERLADADNYFLSLS